MAEDKDFEEFKNFKEWVEANKESSGDQLSSYQDFLKFKGASGFPEVVSNYRCRNDSHATQG